jgi:uncharacterized glyoxalase superfamily protein PhnB
MKFERLIPMMRTWQMEQSIKFYTEVLGFRRESAMEGWALLVRDGAAVMFSAPNQHEGDVAPAFTGSLYIETDEVDALWVSVKDRARVCYPPEDFDYGMREFAIYDNNGYLVQFGQLKVISGSRQK